MRIIYHCHLLDGDNVKYKVPLQQVADNLGGGQAICHKKTVTLRGRIKQNKKMVCQPANFFSQPIIYVYNICNQIDAYTAGLPSEAETTAHTRKLRQLKGFYFYYLLLIKHDK